MALGQFPYTEAQNQEDVPRRHGCAGWSWVPPGAKRKELRRGPSPSSQTGSHVIPAQRGAGTRPVLLEIPRSLLQRPARCVHAGKARRPSRWVHGAQRPAPRSPGRTLFRPGTSHAAPVRSRLPGEGGGTGRGHDSRRKDRLPGCFSSPLSHRRAARARPTLSRTPQHNLQ